MPPNKGEEKTSSIFLTLRRSRFNASGALPRDVGGVLFQAFLAGFGSLPTRSASVNQENAPPSAQ